jgi:peptidyl-dipeptidase A
VISDQPHRLVETLEERFRELEIDFHRAYWDSQIEATPESERRRAELELELRRVKGDPDALAVVEGALQEDIHEPVLRRQLEVLRLSLLGNQMQEPQRELLVELSSAVESDFASFRPELDGRRVSDNEIDEILKSSNDQELRQRAWEASKEVGNLVADRVRELARVRNEMARDLGYADYYQMSLDLQEMPEEWLFDLMEQLEQLTDAPFRQWKDALDDRLRDRFSTEQLYPWHYADPFFQQTPPDGRVSLDPALQKLSPPELCDKTFGSWGIDLDSVLSRSDLYPRENKCQHAFCLDVDRAGDVRILANVVPGERWVEVMLHESGHAAYDITIDPNLPYLLRRPAHIFVTEAIAILSGRLARDPEWLIKVAGLAASEVGAIEEDVRRSQAAHSLLFARWVLVMVHFERDLYADPEADLDARWWELVERMQLVAAPPGRSSPDWAAKIHTAVAPVYYHNYLLGELLASQLEATCVRECGGLVGVKEAGALLSERVFAPGNLMRWNVLIEEATGRGLSPDDFVAGLTSQPS